LGLSALSAIHLRVYGPLIGTRGTPAELSGARRFLAPSSRGYSSS
jgi:hypothetical protein